jgi:hypothetical protein
MLAEVGHFEVIAGRKCDRPASICPDIETLYSVPYLLIHRADLHNVLLDRAVAAEVDIYLDSSCVYRSLIPSAAIQSNPLLQPLINDPAETYWRGPKAHIIGHPISNGTFYNFVLCDLGTPPVGLVPKCASTILRTPKTFKTSWPDLRAFGGADAITLGAKPESLVKGGILLTDLVKRNMITDTRAARPKWVQGAAKRNPNHWDDSEFQPLLFGYEVYQEVGPRQNPEASFR